MTTAKKVVAVSEKAGTPTIARRSVLFDMADRYGMEPAAFEATLRNTVVPGNCSREQFAAFLLVAKEYNLNPLTKEIYAFPTKGGGIQPIVGVDGWSNLMNSHPAFDGMEFEDRINDSGELAAITCKIYRKDREHPVSATEYMAECKRNTEPWQKWPRRMLRHKAMIQAARYAFGFAGIVDPDEAERMAADMARDVTPPRRLTSVAEAFEEFSAPAKSRSKASQDDQPGGQEAAGGEAEGSEGAGDQGISEAASGSQGPSEGEASGGEDAGDVAQDQAAGWPADKQPKTADEYLRYAAAYTAAGKSPDDLATWFKSAEQRKLRNECGVTKEGFDEVQAMVQARVEQLRK